MKTTLLALFLSLPVHATTINWNCYPVFGNSVYSNLTLNFEIDAPSLEYNFNILNNKITLEGTANEFHEDNDDIGDGWTFATPGKRVVKAKKGYSDNFEFYLEVCQDCDFNSANYKAVIMNSDEIFLTEEYGSDGSEEFSVYKCK